MNHLFNSYFNNSEKVEQGNSSILKIVSCIVENCKTSQIKLEYFSQLIEGRFIEENVLYPSRRVLLESLIENIFNKLSEESLVHNSLIETVQSLKKQLLWKSVMLFVQNNKQPEVSPPLKKKTMSKTVNNDINSCKIFLKFQMDLICNCCDIESILNDGLSLLISHSQQQHHSKFSNNINERIDLLFIILDLLRDKLNRMEPTISTYATYVRLALEN